jgi:hypothetical protein
MSDLRALQTRMRDVLLGGTGATLADAILDDGMPVAERLDVYRNNTFVSLKTVLKDAFPAVCRLVDERFFLYAADEFIRAAPPRQACLFAYGEGFPDFLAAFPPCQHLPYLAGVARLEWLMQGASHTTDATPLKPDALAAVGEIHVSDLTFRLEPSLGFFASPWPVDRIWRANRPGAAGDPAIDLDSGGVRIEVRRLGDDVVMRALDPPTFVFRTVLAQGGRFESAAEAALESSPDFDLSAAFGDLFREGAIVGFDLASHGAGAP